MEGEEADFTFPYYTGKKEHLPYKRAFEGRMNDFEKKFLQANFYQKNSTMHTTTAEKKHSHTFNEPKKACYTEKKGHVYTRHDEIFASTWQGFRMFFIHHPSPRLDFRRFLSSLVYAPPREESSGWSAGSFPEQRRNIEPTRPPPFSKVKSSTRKSVLNVK